MKKLFVVATVLLAVSSLKAEAAGNCGITNLSSTDLLLQAVAKSSPECIDLAMSQGAKIGESQILIEEQGYRKANQGESGQYYNSLTLAVKVGSNDTILQKLVGYGAKVDEGAGWGCSTPLVQAASTNNLSAAKFLVSKGANVDQPIPDTCRVAGWDGYSALHFAAKNNSVDVTNFLLDQGANINQVSSSSCQGNITPINDALEAKSMNAVKVLIARGANLNVPTIAGDCNKNLPAITSIWYAGYYGDIQLAKAMIAKGADINYVGYWNQELDGAVSNGNVDYLKFMISQGAKLNLKAGYANYSLFHEAAMSGQAGSIDVLAKAGGWVNELDNYKCTALDYAVNHNHVQAANSLRKAGGKRASELPGFQVKCQDPNL